MPKASPAQTNFTSGELSPRLEGRVDLSKYFNGARTLLNMIPQQQGGVQRRSGFRFVAPVRDSAQRTALLPFEFNVEQAYVLEFGDLYCRFYRNHGQVVDNDNEPYEISTPYAQADLFDADGRCLIKTAQSADILYLCHPSYPPHTLSRSGDTNWSIEQIDFQDGPYLATNSGATTLTSSSGTVGADRTLTASADSFVETDVGRSLRKKSGGGWGWGVITGYVSPTQVTWDIKTAVTAAASSEWRLGVWSGTTGFPTCVTFFQDRLYFAGAKMHPQRLDGSVTGDYANFAPSKPADATVEETHAVAFTLNANNVNVIRWLIDDEKGLVVGSVGGEWLVSPSSLGEALTPTNIQARRSTTRGSANVQPIQASDAILFVQRAGRKVRELAYVFEADGFRSPDMTLLAEHITESGIVAMAYQQEPDSVVWAARKDGVLLGMTYERDQEVIAWHRHVVGGSGSESGETTAKVETLAVIPSPDGNRDEVWAVVQRWVNGRTRRHIEYMEAPFTALARGPLQTAADYRQAVLAQQRNAFFVDSGLSYSGAPVSRVSGLKHLEGETLQILADGATHPDRQVIDGEIHLEVSASKVQAGLGYRSVLQTMRLEAGAADGTAQGKTKRIHRVVIRFFQTLGALCGPNPETLERIEFRNGPDPMDEPPPLFDGDKLVDWPGGYETEGRMTIVQDQPLPLSVLAVFPQVHTQDSR
jgi:hypothetical protein